MKRVAGLLGLLAGCVTPPPPRPPPPRPPPVEVPRVSGARTALETFLSAAQAGRFDQVLPLLAQPLRARYATAERLAADFAADPVAAERLARAGKAITSLRETDDAAALEWAPGRMLRLVREPDGWRVAALE